MPFKIELSSARKFLEVNPFFMLLYFDRYGFFNLVLLFLHQTVTAMLLNKMYFTDFNTCSFVILITIVHPPNTFSPPSSFERHLALWTAKVFYLVWSTLCEISKIPHTGKAHVMSTSIWYRCTLLNGFYLCLFHL